MKNLIIIKLGGSVITDKKTNRPVFRKAVTQRLCREIQIAQKKAGFDLIVIHGAGSFAHPVAKKFRLNEGYLGAESSKGIALTKLAVLELNRLIIAELINAGINAALLETSAVTINSNDKISSFNLNVVKTLLEKDITPVLSGDVVIDTKKGISILSGDQIAVYLARELKTTKVIFVSDVDGIFDKNPKVHKDAKLISKINGDNYNKIIKTMQTHNTNDVTGEMKGKILAIKKGLKGIPVVITNGLKFSSFKQAISNKEVGTKIIF